MSLPSSPTSLAYLVDVEAGPSQSNATPPPQHQHRQHNHHRRSSSSSSRPGSASKPTVPPKSAARLSSLAAPSSSDTASNASDSNNEGALAQPRPRPAKVDTRTPSLSQAGSTSSRSSSLIFTPSSSALRGSAYSSRSSAYLVDPTTSYFAEPSSSSDAATTTKSTTPSVPSADDTAGNRRRPTRLDNAALAAATAATGGLGIAGLTPDFPSSLDDTEDLQRGLEELSRYAQSLPSPLPIPESDLQWRPYEGLIEEEQPEPLLEIPDKSPFSAPRKLSLPILSKPPVLSTVTAAPLSRRDSSGPISPVMLSPDVVPHSRTLRRRPSNQQQQQQPVDSDADENNDESDIATTDDEADHCIRLSGVSSPSTDFAAYRHHATSATSTPMSPDDFEELATDEPGPPAQGVVDLAREDLDNKVIPPNTTHLILSRSQSSGSISDLLSRSLPNLTSGLIVLDLSYCGLLEVPPAIASCTSLQELDIRGNTLATGTLPFFLSNCPALRVLIADFCRLTSLPHSLAPLRHLHTLSLRNNQLRSLPSWIARLASLHTLLVDGNPLHWHWANLVQPILRDPTSVPAYNIPSSPVASIETVSPGRSLEDVSSAVSNPDDSTVSSEGGNRKWGKVFKKVSMAKIRPSTASSPTATPTSAAAASPRPQINHDSRTFSQPVTVSETEKAEAASPEVGLRSKLSTRPTHRGASASAQGAHKRYSYLKLDSQGPTLSAMINASTAAPTHKTTLDHRAGLRSIMAYLRDLDDLSQESARPTSMRSPVIRPRMHRSDSGTSVHSGRSESQSQSPVLRRTVSRSAAASPVMQPHSPQPQRISSASFAAVDADDSLMRSSSGANARDDAAKRARVVDEIIETERTYTRGLQELCDIYVAGASQVVTIGSKRDSIIPASERRAVFGNIEAIRDFHEKIFLPDLVRATRSKENSIDAAVAVSNAFVQHAAFLKIYSSYVNSFDSALTHLQGWNLESKSSFATAAASSDRKLSSPSLVSLPSTPDGTPVKEMSTTRKKKIKTWLKRCRNHPSHSQISLESYLLLPVQRVPRYRLLLESLASYSPSSPSSSSPHSSVQAALNSISLVAAEMNERKRESEGRQMLLYWQNRIGNRFRSPLVQPHRSLIKQGQLTLVRTVKKAATYMDVASSASTPAWPTSASGPSLPRSNDAGVVQIQSLHTELQQQELIALLCSDILVLVHKPSDAAAALDPHGAVDLYTVLRLSNPNNSRAPPAKLFGSDSMLRLTCDTRAILYIRCGGRSNAISWMNAINMQHSLNVV